MQPGHPFGKHDGGKLINVVDFFDGVTAGKRIKQRVGEVKSLVRRNPAVDDGAGEQGDGGHRKIDVAGFFVYGHAP